MNEDHPLLPVIRGWAGNAPPPIVAFAPHHEFQIEVDLAVLGDPRLGQEYAKAQAWKTYHFSMALGYALEGTPCGIEIHAMIYRAACGNPLAFALCDAAGQALRLGTRFFAAFAVSTRLPGFLDALVAWSRNFKYDQVFDARAKLPFVLRDLVDTKLPGADFWFRAIQDGFADPFEFWKISTEEKEKLDDAKRKRAARGTKRSPARYKHWVEWGWLPLSFWAQTAASISCTLDPKAPDAMKAEKTIIRDISALQYSASHNWKLQKFIERAETLAEKTQHLSDL